MKFKFEMISDLTNYRFKDLSSGEEIGICSEWRRKLNIRSGFTATIQKKNPKKRGFIKIGDEAIVSGKYVLFGSMLASFIRRHVALRTFWVKIEPY